MVHTHETHEPASGHAPSGAADVHAPDPPDADALVELGARAGDVLFRLRLSPTRAFEYMGAQILDSTGYSAAEFLADADLAERIVLAEDLPELHELFSRHGDGDFDMDLHWRRRDGDVSVMHVWVRRRVRADGSMVLDGLGRDLTALRSAQAQVEAERARYQALTETMKDVVWILDVEALTFVYVSPSVTGLLGYSAEEVKASPLDAGFDEAALAIIADRLAADLPAIRANRYEIETFESMEIPLRHRDGSTVWTEITGRYRRNNDTGHVEVWGVSKDITERKAAVDALADSERSYRLLAENANDVVLLRGMDGRITWISPSTRTVFGWSDAEMIGHDTNEFVHPDDLAESDTLRERANHGDADSGGIMRLRTHDAAYRYFAVARSPLLDDDGQVVAVIISARDVDELVRQRQRAERSEAILRAMSDARLTPQALLTAVRDADGSVVDFRFTDANRAACTYLGIPKDQLVGQSILDSLPSLRDSALFHRAVTVLGGTEPLLVEDVEVADAAGHARRFDLSAAPITDGLTLDWVDVTRRNEAVERLAESERRFRLLAENTMDVIVHYRDDRIVWVSPAITDALGWPPADCVGQPLAAFVHPDDRSTLDHDTELLVAGRPVIARYRLRSADGQYHWVETHAKPFRDEAGHDDGIVASFRTIDVEVRAEEELERRARFDDLTGLLKRDEVIARLGQRDGRRRPGPGRAVLFVDVDAFKQVNDTHGHRAGDAVLRTLAARITDEVRDSDPVARMGGDEFLVILESVDDLAQGSAVAEKIRRAADEPVRVAGRTLTVTVSVGVTLIQPGEDADDVVARADMAMYAAKSAGRNQVVCLPPPTG